MDTTTLKQQLGEVFEQFISILSPLSNELINKQPLQGNWTIGQLAQHVMLATSGLGDEKTKPCNRPYDQYEPSIRETFLISKEKFQAPEFITPGKRNYDLTELITALKLNRDTLLLAADKKDLTVLCLDIELPGWGHLTRYEWLKLIIYHVQRHTAQLKNLIAVQKEKVA